MAIQTEIAGLSTPEAQARLDGIGPIREGGA